MPDYYPRRIFNLSTQYGTFYSYQCNTWNFSFQLNGFLICKLCFLLERFFHCWILKSKVFLSETIFVSSNIWLQSFWKRESIENWTYECRSLQQPAIWSILIRILHKIIYHKLILADIERATASDNIFLSRLLWCPVSSLKAVFIRN